MKTFHKFKIFLVLCVGLALSLCLANGEAPQAKPNMECTKWVEKCLADFDGIKPGITRGEIEKKFSVDGGISSISTTRFTHSECGYFKIDVEFDLKRDEKEKSGSMLSPDDKVIKVSKPYIERPYMD